MVSYLALLATQPRVARALLGGAMLTMVLAPAGAQLVTDRGGRGRLLDWVLERGREAANDESSVVSCLLPELFGLWSGRKSPITTNYKKRACIPSFGNCSFLFANI
jgi:hypothetical protein